MFFSPLFFSMSELLKANTLISVKQNGCRTANPATGFSWPTFVIDVSRIQVDSLAPLFPAPYF